MGDRTYVLMEIAAKDEVELETIKTTLKDFFFWPNDAARPIIELEEEEANYAYCSDMGDWAAKGFVFKGSHGTGGDYGPEDFCAIDGQLYAVDVSNDGYILCPVDIVTRQPMQHYLKNINHYLDALKKIDAYFETLNAKGGN